MRSAINVLLFLATLGLASRVLDRLPRPRDPRNDAEFAEFLAHKDEFDLLFFGSSRFYRGIVPARFDEVMAERGTPVRSFNLGMRGMRGHEVNELLRRALATEPAKLRWVVVELEEWRPQEKNVWTHRMIAWHDWTETRSVMRSAWLLEESSEERVEKEKFWTRVEKMRVNFLQFLARTFAVGIAAENTRAWFNGWSKPPDEERLGFEELARQWRGYAPFSEEEYRAGLSSENHKELLARRTIFERNMANLPIFNAQEESFDSYNLEALQGQIASVRKAGAEIIYLILPSYEPVPRLHRLREAGHVPNCLAFDDPATWPEFYRVENRFDRRHLNQRGALEFTPVLAERISALIAEE